ncbi:MAG: cadherin-like domain-containing protein, partial [Planctomycetales bacterium]|nr:cadherin-like domain-containing protein [Planctomycetales bacterium]
AGGFASLNCDGTIHYDPNGAFDYLNAGEFATDTFNYTLSDGQGGADFGMVTVTIHGEDDGNDNDAPFAMSDWYSTPHVTLTVAASGVLANDSDSNGDVIVARLISPPLFGSLTYFLSDGSFEYIPDVGNIGIDTFIYEVSDGLESAEATVSIDVTNAEPVAQHHDDVWRWAHSTDSTSINLYSLFDDPDDPDASLSFTAIASNPSLVSSIIVDSLTGWLHITFAYGVSGTSDLVIRATDPTGAFADFELGLTSVEITAVLRHLVLPDGTLTPLPDDQPLFDDDVVSWSVETSPQLGPSDIQAIEWSYSSWPSPIYPNVLLTPFAFAPCNDIASLGCAALGVPPTGHWAVTPRLMFHGAVAMMQAPREEVVYTIESTRWVPYASDADGDGQLESLYSDGQSNLTSNSFGVGSDLLFYAEYNDPPGRILPNNQPAELHDKVMVEVSISPASIPGREPTVFYRLFDPDHYSHDPTFDTNDGVFNRGNDNYLAGGDQVSGTNGGATILRVEIDDDHAVTLSPADSVEIPPSTTRGEIQ